MMNVKITSAVKSRGVLLGALLGVLLSLSACIPSLFFTAATVATVGVVDVTQDRRTAGRYLDDAKLELSLGNQISNHESLGDTVHVNVTSVNGIVLLTGEVRVEEQRQLIAELAKTNVRTRTVVNELVLAGKTNISSRVNDTWITSKVKTRLFKVDGLPANAVTVVTEHSKVYLLGIVTSAEAEAAVNAVRPVKGVTHIVKVFEYNENAATLRGSRDEDAKANVGGNENATDRK